MRNPWGISHLCWKYFQNPSDFSLLSRSETNIHPQKHKLAFYVLDIQQHVSHLEKQKTRLTYWVLVLVRVDACVHDASEQVVHDAGQRLGVQHAMQRAHKHRLTGVQALGGAAHIVTVRDHPGDHLHLEQEGPAGVTWEAGAAQKTRGVNYPNGNNQK